MQNNKQIVLVILDGWGFREDKKDNAIASAKTPNFDALWNKYPHTLLEASGRAVGLPEGQMGNSEVGHTTIGAGKVIANDLVRIADAITDKTFEKNENVFKLFNHVKKNNSALHICGLLGPGGVHSHSEHLYATLRAAKNFGLTNVFIHVFTDGRDTPPQSAYDYVLELEKVITEIGVGKISTLSGRYYAMDRDNNWDRLKLAEDAIFEGKGKISEFKKASDLVKKLYEDGQMDERFEPYVFLDENNKVNPISTNDGVFFTNFRSDRARMLSQKIIEKSKTDNLYFLTMTEYDKTFNCDVVFGPQNIEATLAGEISKAGLTQAHIAETEKFAHATFFLNGGREIPHEGESHILVPSRKDVKTHDLAPKMMAKEIAGKTIDELKKETQFMFVNFANADMVGHTAVVSAIIESLEEVDEQLGRLISEIEKAGAVAFITADHGNAELNVDQETGDKHTAHTTNPVPFIVSEPGLKVTSGTLADIAPTILNILKINKPDCMTGKNLIV
ncbi:MAG: 2,3-bisphosphoglycerate-independent phosphoglycerate mutase [bacterium]